MSAQNRKISSSPVATATAVSTAPLSSRRTTRTSAAASVERSITSHTNETSCTKPLASQSVIPPITVSHAHPAAALNGSVTRVDDRIPRQHRPSPVRRDHSPTPDRRPAASRPRPRTRPSRPATPARSPPVSARRPPSPPTTSQRPSICSRSTWTVRHTCCGRPASGAPRIGDRPHVDRRRLAGARHQCRRERRLDPHQPLDRHIPASPPAAQPPPRTPRHARPPRQRTSSRPRISCRPIGECAINPSVDATYVTAAVTGSSTGAAPGRKDRCRA